MERAPKSSGKRRRPRSPTHRARRNGASANGQHSFHVKLLLRPKVRLLRFGRSLVRAFERSTRRSRKSSIRLASGGTLLYSGDGSYRREKKAFDGKRRCSQGGREDRRGYWGEDRRELQVGWGRSEVRALRSQRVDSCLRRRGPSTGQAGPHASASEGHNREQDQKLHGRKRVLAVQQKSNPSRRRALCPPHRRDVFWGPLLLDAGRVNH